MNKRLKKKKGLLNLKNWKCDFCSKPIRVSKDYEPEMCCNGRECGCFGMPINEIFCTDCEKMLFRR